MAGRPKRRARLARENAEAEWPHGPYGSGIDRRLWRVFLDPRTGDPLVAFYFNGRRDSLPQEDLEELETLLNAWASGDLQVR